MKNKYTVNNIFNDDGIPFNELSSNIGYRLENNDNRRL